MSNLYDYVRHPRAAELQANHAVQSVEMRDIEHPNYWRRLNARVGLRITLAVGTMWCAYIFGLIALLSLPSTIASGSLFEIVVWISSSFLQLVLLPIIIVGQNIQAKAADNRAEDTYKDAEAVLHEAAQIQAHLEAQDAALLKIMIHLENLVAEENKRRGL